jgi:MoxR-like ATPase
VSELVDNTPEDFELSPEQEDYIESVIQKLHNAKDEIGKAVLGQEDLIEGVLISLLCKGHILLEGVPGVAKTVLAESVAGALGLEENRIQGTSDTYPSDIIGTTLMEENKQTGERTFRFEKGPIFTNVFLFDEGNRASPRTQAGALQAMQEGKVTVDGETYKLPDVFFMIMTQNPIEQEGTNPLPEAQKDRFIMQYNVNFPDKDVEKQIGLATTRTQYSLDDIMNQAVKLKPPVNTVIKDDPLKPQLDEDQIIRAQHLVRWLPPGQEVVDAIVDIVRSLRPDLEVDQSLKSDLQKGQLTEMFNYVKENVEFGPGTRAIQAMILAVKARALLHGRVRANLDDVVAMADPILRHRMGMTIAARADNTDEVQVIEKVIEPYQMN